MTTTQDQTAAKIPQRVIWLAVAGAVGGFLFGFDSSVINGAVDAIKDEFALSEAVTGFVVAVALLGCAVGAFLAGKVADRYGRIPRHDHRRAAVRDQRDRVRASPSASGT